jgi:hypothetical protein
VPTLGLEIPGAELPPMVGEVLNVPVPVIGAGPVPGAAPKVPVVPDGATGDTPVAPGVAPAVPGAAPTAPVPPAAPGAAVWANETGAAAINAAATAAGIKDFRLSMRVSFELQKGKPGCRKHCACVLTFRASSGLFVSRASTLAQGQR